MGGIIGPKCFISSVIFLLTILSIYGIVGVVLNYQQIFKFPSFGEWPFNLRPLFAAFMIIQGIIPAIAFFGILARCRKEPKILYGSGSVLLGIFTASIVFGCVSIRINEQDIINEFYKAMKKNLNGSASARARAMNWMDDTQWQFKCCGVYSFHDWYKFDESDDLPNSCCRRDGAIPNLECGEGLLTEAKSIDFNPGRVIYTTGCGEKFAKNIERTTKRIGIELLLVGGLALGVAIFIYTFVTKLFVNTIGPKANTPGGVVENNNESPSNADTVSTTGTLKKSVDDNNNSFKHSKAYRQRERERLIEKRRKKVRSRQGSVSRFGQPFGPTRHYQNISVQPITRNEINGNINESKSFILGEAQSHIMNTWADGKDKDLIRKNVDMLWYQSLENNMSTLSTTPTGISCNAFSSNVYGKRCGMGMAGDLNGIAGLNDEEQRNTVYTLVSERPFTPSLSQNCSVSIFSGNNVGKAMNGNGETPSSPIGQSSQASKPLRYQTTAEKLTEENETQPESSPTESTPSPDVTTTPPPSSNPTLPPPPPVVLNNNEKPSVKEVESPIEDNSSTDALINQVNATAQPLPATAAAKYANPTASVRSTTLATIQEESESTKMSPKAASPASGYMSPEGVLSPQPTEANLISEKDNETVNVSQYPGNNNSHQNACNNNRFNKTLIDNSKGDNDSFQNAGYDQEIKVGPQTFDDSRESQPAKDEITKVASDLNQNKTSQARLEIEINNDGPTAS